MSPVRSYNDPDEERAYIDRSRQSWDRILAARRAVTQADAQAVSTMAANYPHMSPGTVVPLTQAGVAPDDPLAQYTATQEAKSNKRKRGFFGAIGDWANPVNFIGNVGEFVVGDVLNPIGGAALGATKQVLRPGLAALSAPYEVATGVFRNIADVGGNMAAGLAGGAAVGAAVGLPFGGIGSIPGAVIGAGVGAVAGIGAGALATAKGVEIESEEGLVNPLAQSTLFQSFGEKGLGSGYMPGGTAHEAAADAARRSAAISGHGLTPGRFLASAVVEEGTAPYNLLSGAMDAATAWRLDPTFVAGKGVNVWRKTQKGFTATEREIQVASRLTAVERADAGLVEGARKTIIGEKVDAWLGTAKGQKSLQWFADHNFEAIRTQLGSKVDVATVKELANASTIDEVDAIFRPKLGIARGLEQKPTVGGFGMDVKRLSSNIPIYGKVSESRLWSDLPSGKVDYSDPTKATDQFALLLRDANISAEESAPFIEEFAGHLLKGDFDSRRLADAVAYRALGGAQGKVALSSAGQAFMNKLGRRASASDSSVLRALIDEDVTKTPSTHASIDGKTVNLPSAGFLTDHFDNGFDVDRNTLRGIRAATSKYARIINNPKLNAQVGVSALSGMTDTIWKPAVLLRGAWTVRVIGEEQIRMAAAGRLSLFNHPMSYLAWAMDDSSRISQILKKASGGRVEAGGRGSVDVTGERFAREGSTIKSAADDIDAELLDAADDFATASNYRQSAEAWYGNDLTTAGHKARYSRGTQGHVEAVAENIDTAFGDPVMRMLATEPRHVVRQWFLSGEGNVYRQALINKHGAKLSSNADVDRHLDNAARTLNKIMGRVEEVRPGLSPIGGVSTPDVPGGGAYGRHPGIEARAPVPARPEVAPPVLPERPTPLSTSKERPPRPGYSVPTKPARPNLDPRIARNVEERAAYEAQTATQKAAHRDELAKARTARERDEILRRQREEMFARYRSQQAGGAAPTGPSYGNAATQRTPLIEPARVTPGRAGSPTIRDAIAKGEINGVPIRLKNGKVNPEFTAELKKLDVELPDEIVGTAAHLPGDRWKAKRDQGVQNLYTALMTRPSAKLSRSPAFRQTYWSEAENLITELDPAAQARLLQNARVAKLDNTAVKRLEERAKASSGDLTLDEADLLLKGRGLDETQKLLYDAAKRGQISDVLRIIMPFAEAQKEVMGTWAKLGLVDNVTVVPKAAKVLNAARGSGFFYKDPGTGEEMFTFPGSAFINEKFLGVPVPLTGRVAGLNTFGTGIIPGLGPAVQLPTRWFLPDKPQFDDIRKFIDPFGANAAETEGLLESMAPGWVGALRKAFSDPESDRTFGNAVKDTWAQGVSAGRYSTETPDDIREGLEHAKSTARWLYIFKAGAQVFGAPTPPSPAFMAMDKDGKWHMAKALSEDYRKMIDDPEIGFEGANAAFVNKYGNNAAAFMQSKTFSTVPSAPSTGDFRQWTRTGEAKALQARYGDVYALFGPQGEGFDYTQYLRNIQSGATETLTPTQFAEQTNDRQGKMIFYEQKDRFGPSPTKEQRAWLSDLRVQLREKFPGFDIPVPGKPDQRTIKQQFIPQIERAVADPALEGNEVARATRAYLQARTMATQAAEAAGYKSFDQAKNAAPLRDWLRQVLDVLTRKVPDFGPMAERVFDREMVDDTTPEQTAVSA